MQPVEVELHRAVGGHGGGSAEHDLTHVDGYLRAEVDHVCNGFCFGAEVAPAGTAVGVELNMGEVGGLPFFVQVRDKPHGSEGAGVVAGFAEVVAVQVNRVREAEHFVCFDDAFDELGGGEVEEGDGFSDTFDVFAPAPHFGSQGVGEFDAVSFDGVEPPGDEGCRTFDVAGCDRPHDTPVSVEEGQDKAVL